MDDIIKGNKNDPETAEKAKSIKDRSARLYAEGLELIIKPSIEKALL
jgi:hypothetical protein